MGEETMNNKDKIITKQNTNWFPNNSAPELNLRIRSRDEIEANRTDFNRFCQPNAYLTEKELQYFRDPVLRDLFVKVFWECPDNVTAVLDEAVEKAGGTFRVRQIRDLVIHMLIKDGKIDF